LSLNSSANQFPAGSWFWKMERCDRDRVRCSNEVG
jgi:hypothetical protein